MNICMTARYHYQQVILLTIFILAIGVSFLSATLAATPVSGGPFVTGGSEVHSFIHFNNPHRDTARAVVCLAYKTLAECIICVGCVYSNSLALARPQATPRLALP